MFNYIAEPELIKFEHCQLLPSWHIANNVDTLYIKTFAS